MVEAKNQRSKSKRKKSRSLAQQAKEIVDVALKRLKDDLNAFADSIAAAAELQVKGHEQMIAFFNADMTRFKQWAKHQDLYDVFSGFVLDEEESQSETETTASCSVNGDDE